MRPRGGMTLVEVLIATFLLVGGLGTLLFGMYYAMIHAEYVKQAQVAMNAAQGRLEQLAAMDFDALWEGGSATGTFASARGSQQLESQATILGAGSNLAIQIRPVPLTDTTPDLLDIHVAACWQHRGRAIGEVACADGVADGVANWWVDSPISASTRVARKQ